MFGAWEVLVAMFEAFRLGAPAAAKPAGGGGADVTARASKRQKLLGGLHAGRAASPAAPPPPPPAAAAPAGGLGELLGDAPLRLVIVGHNPSDAAWREGHYYAHKSNHMWRILRDTGIAPPDAVKSAADDALMPRVAGVGFCDVGTGTPGTKSAAFSMAVLAAWREPFFDRLRRHAARAARTAGCRCGGCAVPPVLVAFAGKRQFSELFSKGGRKAAADGPGAGDTDGAGDADGAGVRLQAARPAAIDVGPQRVLPAGWPLPLDATEVWVMPSTSGAAAMTADARRAPWRRLAARLAAEPWPCAAPRLACGGAPAV